MGTEPTITARPSPIPKSCWFMPPAGRRIQAIYWLAGLHADDLISWAVMKAAPRHKHPRAVWSNHGTTRRSHGFRDEFLEQMLNGATRHPPAILESTIISSCQTCPHRSRSASPRSCPRGSLGKSAGNSSPCSRGWLYGPGRGHTLIHVRLQFEDQTEISIVIGHVSLLLMVDVKEGAALSFLRPSTGPSSRDLSVWQAQKSLLPGDGCGRVLTHF